MEKYRNYHFLTVTNFDPFSADFSIIFKSYLYSPPLILTASPTAFLECKRFLHSSNNSFFSSEIFVEENILFERCLNVKPSEVNPFCDSNYMCLLKPDKRIAQSTLLSETRSKFQLLIENYAKLIVKNKRILKIFIFKYITKSCYLIVYSLEKIFKENNLK
jgi:hypothetical protein